jgi:uncharacterized protein (DUF849 family)
VATFNAQVQAVTQDLDKLRETVNKALLLSTATSGGREGTTTRDSLVGRMQVLADMRREEKLEFERKDYLRQQEVRELRLEVASLRKEDQETSAALAELLRQFRKMLAYLIALVGGDLSREDVR